MTRVLILTTAVGYTPKQIAPFWVSLNKYGFKGRLTLLVDSKTAEAFKPFMPPNYHLLVHDPQPTAALVQAAPQAVRDLVASGMNAVSEEFLLKAKEIDPDWVLYFNASFSHPSVYRYGFYYQYLQKHHDQFDAVILCDSRDVLFQRNPEDVLSADDPFTTGLEYKASLLEYNPFNQKWISQLYGVDALDRYAKRRISCSGSSYGNTVAVLDYLQKLSHELIILSRKTADRYGYDQGVHNKMLWNDELPGVCLTENYHGELANLVFEPAGDVKRLMRNGVIHRADTDTPIMLVHQFDRIPEIMEDLLSQCIEK